MTTSSSPQFMRFPSRRSVVHGTHGMVACTQPLAAQAGIRILREGGNAADAAVAVAAVLNVTEPGSTGIGGDMFCLYFDPKTHKVHSLNGSGRSPAGLTLEHALATIPPDELSKSNNRIPEHHVHTVTVPGAAAGWCDTVKKFGSGRLSLAQILAPAIKYAEDGFPVSAVSVSLWAAGESVLKKAGGNWSEWLIGEEGRAPREGELMRLPGLAKTLRLLTEHGKKGFYQGQVADAIVKAVQGRGGVMTLEDLRRHGEIGSEEMEPISIEVPWGRVEGDAEKKRLWECAPNGQGLVALQTLGILSALESSNIIPPLGTGKYTHNSTEYLHALITSLRLAFSDGHDFIHDPANPAKPPIPLKGLLSEEYLTSRAKLFDPGNSIPAGDIPHGSPPDWTECDTVYFAVTDSEGGACSFINSIFSGFGSGILPDTYSFPLHNRGRGFLLSNPPSSPANPHPNLLAPNKRPYHTIIPALLTSPSLTSPTGLALDTVLGVMGGYMQPQGHVQLLLNLLAFNMSPQEALDAPRICLASASVPGEVTTPTGGEGRITGKSEGVQEREGEGAKVFVEEGIDEEVVNGLKKLGYVVIIKKGWDREVFGRGQCIRVRSVEIGGERGVRGRVYSGGSDLRGDGCCVGY